MNVGEVEGQSGGDQEPGCDCLAGTAGPQGREVPHYQSLLVPPGTRPQQCGQKDNREVHWGHQTDTPTHFGENKGHRRARKEGSLQIPR